MKLLSFVLSFFIGSSLMADIGLEREKCLEKYGKPEFTSYTLTNGEKVPRKGGPERFVSADKKVWSEITLRYKNDKCTYLEIALTDKEHTFEELKKVCISFGISEKLIKDSDGVPKAQDFKIVYRKGSKEFVQAGMGPGRAITVPSKLIITKLKSKK